MVRNRSESRSATGAQSRESPRPPCRKSTAGPVPSVLTHSRVPLTSTSATAATIASRAMAFDHVLVVGAGQMGGGIAQVVAASGRHVSLYDAAPGAVDRALQVN